MCLELLALEMLCATVRTICCAKSGNVEIIKSRRSEGQLVNVFEVSVKCVLIRKDSSLCSFRQIMISCASVVIMDC